MLLYGLRAWAVIALEPTTQPIQTGEQHTFGNVNQIELVAHFPFERRRNDDTLVQVGLID